MLDFSMLRQVSMRVEACIDLGVVMKEQESAYCGLAGETYGLL